MAWIVVGLGNHGEEYEGTRHNAGRMALEHLAKRIGAEWRENKKAKARVARGMVGKTAVVLMTPDTMMNRSGVAVAKFVKSAKAAERMVVVYDDLDLPLGALKLSFDRGSGGHKGVESVIRAVRTKKFARVRIGVSPSSPSGKPKKPSGEKEVVEFILARFKVSEAEALKSVFKKAIEAIETVVYDGIGPAMNRFN